MAGAFRGGFESRLEIPGRRNPRSRCCVLPPVSVCILLSRDGSRRGKSSPRAGPGLFQSCLSVGSRAVFRPAPELLQACSRAALRPVPELPQACSRAALGLFHSCSRPVPELFEEQQKCAGRGKKAQVTLFRASGTPFGDFQLGVKFSCPTAGSGDARAKVFFFFLDFRVFSKVWALTWTGGL